MAATPITTATTIFIKSFGVTTHPKLPLKPESPEPDEEVVAEAAADVREKAAAVVLAVVAVADVEPDTGEVPEVEETEGLDFRTKDQGEDQICVPPQNESKYEVASCCSVVVQSRFTQYSTSAMKAELVQQDPSSLQTSDRSASILCRSFGSTYTLQATSAPTTTLSVSLVQAFICYLTSSNLPHTIPRIQEGLNCSGPYQVL